MHRATSRSAKLSQRWKGSVAIVENCGRWPRTPKGFADLLRRAAPALRQLGIEVHSLPKTGGVIKWVIEEKLPRACPERPACPAEQDIKTCRTSNLQVLSEDEPGGWV